MVDVAYRAWRATLYISGSYPYTIQDDKVNESFVHSFTYKLGIDEFDSEGSELEKMLS